MPLLQRRFARAGSSSTTSDHEVDRDRSDAGRVVDPVWLGQRFGDLLNDQAMPSERIQVGRQHAMIRTHPRPQAMGGTIGAPPSFFVVAAPWLPTRPGL